MKRTLKRELKVLEIAKREAVDSSTRGGPSPPLNQHQFVPRELAPGEVTQPCREAGPCVLNPGAVPRRGLRIKAQADADEMEPTDPS